MQVEGKKLKPIRYGPFEIQEKIDINAFHLSLSPYMHIYLVVNVENFKLYESPMILDEEVDVQIPFVDDLSSKYMTELQEDVILHKNRRTSRRGVVEYLRVGLTGMNPSKEKWMEVGKVRELYPHILSM